MTEENKFTDPDQFIKKAKALVTEAFNGNFPIDTMTRPAEPQDFYIVWFAKTLGSWKALVSTDIINDVYWEVTYNGYKKETYVDVYVKHEQRVFSDEVYAALS